MEGMEEEKESEDEWPVFDEVDQTIDEVTNNVKQPTKPPQEKDIKSTPNPVEKNALEKKAEKTPSIHTNAKTVERNL